MGETEKPTGIDALRARLEELGASEEAASEKKEEKQEVTAPETKSEIKVEAKVEEKTEEKVEEKELLKAKEPEKIIIDDDKSKVVEPAYTPNYQFKFQDQLFEFDDRVKATIKSKEDEDFYRDLYTKARGMEVVKTKAEETKKSYSELETKYSNIEQKAKENDLVINYWTTLMDGINKGDANSFNQLLSLCNVNNNTLQSLGKALADNLEHPEMFVNQQKERQINYNNESLKKQEANIKQEQERLALERTEYEIKKAMSNPEISEIASYVDEHWGAGSFESAIWQTGQELQNRNQTVTFNDIPNIVKDIAGRFGKFRQPTPKQEVKEQVLPEKKPVVKTRVVSNNTDSLPNISGEQGVPINTKYKEGSGIDGLRNRYKDVSGDDL